jgi:50S ribosomal subunit-associated GTPase HflX
MSERALVASRAGTVRPWLEPAVAALGHEVVGTLVVDAPEHGEYHLPPGLVERLADRIEATDSGYLAIDGHVHPGQAADLLAALPPVVLRDRRGVAYERLAAGGNGAAATLLERQERRTERRQAANQSREAATEGPTGTAGRVEELERRCQRLDERLAERQAAAREAVETGYAVVDARVVLLGPPTAPTTPLWAELTGAEPRDGGPLAPAEPVTATARIGPHEVAVTDTPGAVEELPEWFAGSVPGTVAALERADVVVLVGSAGTRPRWRRSTRRSPGGATPPGCRRCRPARPPGSGRSSRSTPGRRRPSASGWPACWRPRRWRCASRTTTRPTRWSPGCTTGRPSSRWRTATTSR